MTDLYPRTDTRFVFKPSTNTVSFFSTPLEPTQDLYLNVMTSSSILSAICLEPTQDLYLNIRIKAIKTKGNARTDTRFVFKQP